ncbi:mediator complex subunit MED14 domain-containing protein [Ditylenchus destructor]|uniref:Mediator of RNA polymerase II transcription subunit 14 n=1 Tax=Ditylenchus destructor TaxID=166010 RepID=A0AAD4MSZ0_9BILA|nr:mediator complex subunit MED14 domain-containing protein [Ditylenchus destructor]
MMPVQQQQQDGMLANFASQLRRTDLILDGDCDEHSNGVSALVTLRTKQLPTHLLPQVPDKCGTPTISLALLIDFAVQQTLHELTVLCELLPKKKENDRKISVVQFAHSTRLIFVKLLAIVKWIRQSKKFEPLSAIRYFLDQQASHFVDTADRLVIIAREELRFARLPIFQVPQAVDVLTLGSYPRLPQSIKDRFILKTSLSKTDQARTLRRLNHVIEYHLALNAHSLSPRIDSVTIRNGMAILKASGEFQISLTILGEMEPSNAQWILLDIKILVENYDVGYGQKLVHPLQINFLHQIVQEKLQTSDEPLRDAYIVLHTFCRSLQLDVLYCQVMQIGTISQSYLKVEEYDAVKSVLAISYWLARDSRRRLTSTYRISFSGDIEDPHCGLRTRHYPSSPYLPILEDTDNLSLSRLISETIIFRCRERLLRVEKLLGRVKPKVQLRRSGHSLMTLTYPLVVVGECRAEEELRVSVNTFSGAIVCQVPSLDSRREVTDLESQLSAGEPSLDLISKILRRLRVLMMIERFNRAITSLQVRPATESQIVSIISKLKQLPPDRRFLQFNREEQYYLVVTFVPDDEVGVLLEFFLFSNVGGKFNMMKLDPVEVAKSTPVPILERENARSDPYALDAEDSKLSWIGTHRQLQAAVAAIDDRLLFLRITEELDKRNIKHDPLSVEPVVGGHVLKIKDVSAAMDVKCDAFFKNLVGCYLRLDIRQNLIWPFECTMKNCPLVPDCDVNQPGCSTGGRQNRTRTFVQEINTRSMHHIASISEAISIIIIERLSIYCHVYEPIKRFSYAYYDYYKDFCSVQAFTYHKLVLAYGDDRDLLMILSWKPKMLRSKAQYTINFGQCTKQNMSSSKSRRKWNPHVCVAQLLSEKFNKDKDLISLVHYLVNTCQSLDYIYNFSRNKLHSTKALSQVLGLDAGYPVELQSHLIALNETNIRLTYGSTHTEFLLLSDNRVAVRESSKPLSSGTSPIAFEAFWRKQAGGSLPNYTAPSNTSTQDQAAQSQDAPTSSAALGATKSISTSTLAKSPQAGATGNQDNLNAPSHSPYRSPKSYPSQTNAFSPSVGRQGMQANSPILSPRMTLSVPTSMDTTASTSAATESSPRPELSGLDAGTPVPHSSIVVDDTILARAMSRGPDNSASPLEQYFYGLTLLSRIYAAVDTCRRVAGLNHIPLIELHSQPGSITLLVKAYALPVLKEHPVVKLNIFICPQEFRLIAKLEYNGSITPAESDIRIFERYFECQVVPLFNEMALLTFVSICRMSVPSVFNSFAQLMLAEMEPNPNYRWKVNLQLATTQPATNDSVASSQRKVQIGVIVTQSCSQVAFVICIRPTVPATSGLRAGERVVRLSLAYKFTENELDLMGQAIKNADELAIQPILNRNKQMSDQPTCLIWPCIRDILENHSI